ncbi:MAG: SPOR domain-containing protein [Burkholderiales bacterium]|jgi:cell division protein FtsN|nr:SPOR domain-containing protein [Burkholderiales bacterium]
MAQRRTTSFRWGTLFTGIFVGIVTGLVLALTAAWKLGGSAVLEVFATKDKPAASQRIPDNAPTAKTGGEKPNFDFYKVLPEGGDATAQNDKTIAPATPAARPAEQRPATVAAIPENSATRPVSATPTATSAKPKDIYWLQVGSFSRQEEAENRKAELALFGWEATVQRGESPGRGILYRVRVGPYDNAEQTGRMKAELTQRKFDAAVVRQ